MIEKTKYFLNKLLYSITLASSILPWVSCGAALYYFLYNNQLSHIGFFKSSAVFYALLAFVLLFPFAFCIWLRWLPTSIYIPPKTSGGHPLDYKVLFSVSSVFDQPGDIMLAYNRNNIVGGKYSSKSGKAKEPNLMAAFMSHYFGDGTGNNVSFDWNLFKDCYDHPLTKVYHCDSKGDLREIDKNSIPLKSAYSQHWQANASLNPFAPAGAGGLFPEGSVLALKLPPGSGRNYAFFLCCTEYDLQKGKKPISSLETLEACLTTAWKVIDKTPDVDPRHTCIPFLGRGHSGLDHVYGILWSIVFSYRKAVSGRPNPDFGLNICLRLQELRHNHVKINEIARFLTYALRG